MQNTSAGTLSTRLNAESVSNATQSIGERKRDSVKGLRRDDHYLRRRNRPTGTPDVATLLVAIPLSVLLAWLFGLLAWSIG
jgi:hypothetical protein